MPRVLNKNGLIAVLDIGTSKTVCLIARPVGDDGFEPVAAGTVQSLGVDKSEIADLKDAVSTINHALAAAERETGERIETVVASACAGTLTSALINESVDLGGQETTEADMSLLIEKAQSKIPENAGEILHCIPIDYAVDARHEIKNPLGLSGDKLSVVMHTVEAPVYPVRDMNAVLDQSRIQCSKKVASPYAAGLCCLKKEEAEQGSVVIDLGAGTTGIGFFYNGQFVFCDKIPIGANRLTKDLVKHFEMSYADAERIKTLYGSAVPSSAYEKTDIAYPIIGDDSRVNNVVVPQSEIVRIIEKRIEEIFISVRTVLESRGFYEYCMNVVLTGGGSKLHGVCEKAEEILERKVRIGYPVHWPERQHVLKEAQYPFCATAIGLLYYTTRHLLNSSYAREATVRSNNKIVRFFRWFLDNVK